MMPGQPWLSEPGRCVSARELNGNGPRMFSNDVIVAAARLASDTPAATGTGTETDTGADVIPSGVIAEGSVCAGTTFSVRRISFSTPCVAYELTVTSPALAVVLM